MFYENNKFDGLMTKLILFNVLKIKYYLLENESINDINTVSHADTICSSDCVKPPA